MEKKTLLLILYLNLTFTSVFSSVSFPICSKISATDYILNSPYQTCPVSLSSPRFFAVTEGDDRWLQTAMDMINKDNNNNNNEKCDYVSLLFYANWCPFSTSFKPTFNAVSSLYSSIPHFSIKESSVKPSTLSKYGVHGFPTLLLLNSTMRARYQGNRTLGSLVSFYSDFTGIEMLNKTSIEETISVPHPGNQNDAEQEICPFTWAKSPENMLQQETYLALSTLFVLLRLLHLISPTLLAATKLTWRRIAQNVKLGSLSEHTVGYLSRGVQLCMRLKEPCKRRSNLQGGAMNARAWASKSLATVSIGDSSSSNRGGSSASK
ncbi:unnamed protein product [Cochlearia groenlandica]